jgi:signal transduction histidine kinase
MLTRLMPAGLMPAKLMPAKLMPDRLSQWLMALAIGGILATQALALTLYHSDRVRAVQSAESRQAAQCLAGFEQVLASEPPELRRAIMHPLLFRPRSEAPVDQPQGSAPAAGDRPPQGFLIHLPSIPGHEQTPPPAPDQPDHEDLLRQVQVHGSLPDGTALTLEAPPSLGQLFNLEFVAYVGGVIGVALIGAIWAITLATNPLRRLSEAADRFGTDVNAAPLAESGPREVRQAASAFNRMQRRLRQFIQDRTRMLAAMSHDLRTPLTRLRLRTELMEDAEQRDRMLGDLMEMEQMVGAALAFAREQATDEPAERHDLKRLADSVCADAIETGQDVHLGHADDVCVLMRPGALKRAIVNVVDNAAQYAGGAEVTVDADNDEAVLRVIDHGPGIPEAERENVLRPFYRCEGSRSRDTGGIGLGLSIASDAISAHGGRMALIETPGGGLTVEIRLPAA